MASVAVSVGGQAKDDALTLCAISVVAGVIGNVVHEGLGHGAVALLMGAQSGVLTTVAWSSEFDSRLVAAGGTLANLTAALVSWIALRSFKGAPVRWRFFLLTSVAFNLFDGTGYFLFSGATDFGDCAAVIAGWPRHWLWRTLLIVGGAASYYGSVLVVGSGLVRYVGVAKSDMPRLRRLTYVPYFTSVLVSCVSGLLNPIGLQLLWQSALPASAGGHSGLLWLRYYISRGAVPERELEGISRSYLWIVVAAVLLVVFVFVLGRGITLHR